MGLRSVITHSHARYYVISQYPVIRSIFSSSLRAFSAAASPAAMAIKTEINEEKKVMTIGQFYQDMLYRGRKVCFMISFSDLHPLPIGSSYLH